MAEVRDSGTAQSLRENAESSREFKSEPADEVGARFKMVIGICNLHHQIRTASVPSFGGIELASCCLDSGAVLPGPHAKTADGFEQGMS